MDRRIKEIPEEIFISIGENNAFLSFEKVCLHLKHVGISLFKEDEAIKLYYIVDVSDPYDLDDDDIIVKQLVGFIRAEYKIENTEEDKDLTYLLVDLIDVDELYEMKSCLLLKDSILKSIGKPKGYQRPSDPREKGYWWYPEKGYFCKW